MQDGNRNNGPNKAELALLLKQIEETQKQVEDETKSLKSIKDLVKENERKQIDERAEAAAQQKMLEDDQELRRAIQEEERKKILKVCKHDSYVVLLYVCDTCI